MDILDWIPGSCAKEVVQGGVSPLDMARQINLEEMAMRAIISIPEPLLVLHPGNPSRTVGGKVEEQEHEEKEKEGNLEERATGYTQESKALQRKKATQIATPQSKFAPILMVDDA